LARKVLFEEYEVDDYVEELGTTVGESMLKVHCSYLPIIQKLREVEGVHGFSHITGGGIEGNTSRIIPKGLSLKIEWDAWNTPPLFKHIKEIGNVPDDDMRSTFNLGIGLIAVVSASAVNKAQQIATEAGEETF